MPRTRRSRRVILVVGLIAAIIGGSAGVYLFLALPGPVFSTSLTANGVGVTIRYDVTIGFPKTQMEVSLELLFAPLSLVIEVQNSSDIDILYNVLPTTLGTYSTIWLNTPPGSYRIYIGWTGGLEARITVLARGPPYAA